MSLTWRGDQVKAKIRMASIWGIDKTMADAVIGAKQSHPGWKNRTGTAEGSIRIVDTAQPLQGGVVGRWGSVDVNYMIWLELKHGSALRSSADRHYPKLPKFIAQRFKG